jgi:uncharacterized protein YutE (UPF0331/DUF86 family)
MDQGCKNFLNLVDQRINEIEKEKQEGKTDFEKFVTEVWSRPKQILTTVLLGHIYVESRMNILLNKTFVNSKRIEKYLFEKKLEIIESLGSIDHKNVEKLRTLNQIRNKLAHNLDYEIPLNLAQIFSTEAENLAYWKKDPNIFMAREVSQIAGYLNNAISSQRKIKPIKLADSSDLFKLIKKNVEKDPNQYKKYYDLIQ